MHGRGLLEESCDTQRAPASSSGSLPRCPRCAGAAWPWRSPCHQPTLWQLHVPPASSTERKIRRVPAWSDRLFLLTFLQRKPRQRLVLTGGGSPGITSVMGQCEVTGTPSAAAAGRGREQRQEEEIGPRGEAGKRESQGCTVHRELVCFLSLRSPDTVTRKDHPPTTPWCCRLRKSSEKGQRLLKEPRRGHHRVRGEAHAQGSLFRAAA